MSSRILAAALAASSSIAYAAINNPPLEKGFGPSQDVARCRGPQIFNAINNAMRQWGSSLHHNGMSFYLATVPEGVIFHHGNENETSPAGPEWLAYEIEHAESFALGRRGPPGGSRPPPSLSADADKEQHAMVDDTSSASPQITEDTQGQGGWLHTYRTTRPLRYLYVDGMSGGKTTMGTLDTQDYLLRNDRTTHYTMDKSANVGERPGGPMNERRRAFDLCEMSYYWDLSGIIRMEAGFEIIHCDFEDGLEQIQVLQRPSPKDGEHGRAGSLDDFEFMRALSERYDGIGSSRTTIDFSSMVSAFFYPVNLSNPDPKRPDLPRLASVTDAELAAIKTDLDRVIALSHNGSDRTVDWQDVTDLVVARYADRLKYMTEKVDTAEELLDEINHLLLLYIDHSGKDAERSPSAAIDRCTHYYLHGVSPQTQADNLIQIAIKSVTTHICTKLFDAREVLINRPTTGNGAEHLALAMDSVRSLMDYLGWARFKKCSQCDVDEVCVIPMWPFGTKEDYESPRCANSSNIQGEGQNYWGGFGRPSKPGGPPGTRKDGRGPLPLPW
jgi:hypothetical protein